jgi:ubiquinone/menaquinone biosynthesis C-methylase UbiE
MTDVRPSSLRFKDQVRQFWNTNPCGTRSNPHPRGTKDFFAWVEEERDHREPFIAQYAEWDRHSGKRVLEMGVGAGTDFVRFVRAGAHAVGVDLSDESAALVRQRLRIEGLRAPVLVSDIESLPFRSQSFDAVYSWGVIHHTERPPSATAELLRVLKPGGAFTVMLYHRHSLVALQAYLLHGLLKGQPWRTLDAIAREHLESFGTRLYSRKSARELFPGIDVGIHHIVTPYDLRYGRFKYLPASVGRIIPSFFGYFMVLKGVKPERQHAALAHG